MHRYCSDDCKEIGAQRNLEKCKEQNPNCMVVTSGNTCDKGISNEHGRIQRN